MNIIAGALEMRKKTVADVMTRIDDVYMLDYNSTLDFETISEIMKTGIRHLCANVYIKKRERETTLPFILKAIQFNISYLTAKIFCLMMVISIFVELLSAIEISFVVFFIHLVYN